MAGASAADVAAAASAHMRLAANHPQLRSSSTLSEHVRRSVHVTVCQLGNPAPRVIEPLMALVAAWATQAPLRAVLVDAGALSRRVVVLCACGGCLCAHADSLIVFDLYFHSYFLLVSFAFAAICLRALISIDVLLLLC